MDVFRGMLLHPNKHIRTGPRRKHAGADEIGPETTFWADTGCKRPLERIHLNLIQP